MVREGEGSSAAEVMVKPCHMSNMAVPFFKEQNIFHMLLEPLASVHAHDSMLLDDLAQQ